MHDICVARREGRQAELPVARPKKVLPVRETTLLLLTDGERILLERRPPVGIWGGLLSLPECAADKADEFASRHGCRLVGTQEMPVLRHTFSHFHLNIQTVACVVEAKSNLVAEDGWQWLQYGDVDDAALPTPIRCLLKVIAEKEGVQR
jgi:A/G-specific adenine glycosylase